MSHGRALSYHDVVLRLADVDLLRGPHWLNDQVGATSAPTPPAAAGWSQVNSLQERNLLRYHRGFILC